MEAVVAEQDFIASLPEAHQTTVKTLIGGWTAGGGDIDVGKVSLRLRAKYGTQHITAGTITNKEPHQLELCRVVLENHGMTNDEWIHWSDDLADIPEFDASAKYPVIPLNQPLPEVLRIAQDLRDLALKYQ